MIPLSPQATSTLVSPRSASSPQHRAPVRLSARLNRSLNRTLNRAEQGIQPRTGLLSSDPSLARLGGDQQEVASRSDTSMQAAQERQVHDAS
jgi:hypothetical protein